MPKADQFRQYAEEATTLGSPIQNRKREASLYRPCAHMDASCGADEHIFGVNDSAPGRQLTAGGR
jgi:hypothetical protein